MARDWPMLGWECEDFAREFPDGEMKGEYGGGRVILGERHWMDKVRDAGQHIEQCDTPQCNDRGTKPHAAPHVWHVKDEEPYATRHRIQQMFRVPYFMENDPIGRTLNKPDVNESLEFWLSPPGAGAFAHADAYCTMTASVQLSGHKRWRMMNPGPQVDSVFDRFDTQDSGALWKSGVCVVGEGGGVCVVCCVLCVVCCVCVVGTLSYVVGTLSYVVGTLSCIVICVGYFLVVVFVLLFDNFNMFTFTYTWQQKNRHLSSVEMGPRIRIHRPQRWWCGLSTVQHS